jgi:Zinc finger, C2H2 type
VSERETQAGDAEVAVCHMCGQTFSSQEMLSKHLMDAHDDEGLVSEGSDPS